MPSRFASPIITLLFGVLAGGWLASASEVPPAYFARSWLVDEGLPTPQANDVVQDADGFLWVATPEGVVRFDGVQFKSFTSPLLAKVAAKNIRALARNVDGSVLILPAVGGLVELKHGQFRSHPAATGIEGMQLRDVFVERNGAIWLEMQGGRVRRWHAGRVEDFGLADGLNERGVATFGESAKGDVWVASGSFYGRYDDGKFQPIPGDPRHAAVLASSSSGGVWACKGTALRRLERDQVQEISTNLPWTAVGGVVRTMYEDRDGMLWIGTAAHGVFRWANGEFAQVEAAQSQIRAILQDEEGSLWIASEGSGLTRLRPKVFQMFNAASGLAVNVSDSVSADPSGIVWAANRAGGVGRILDGQAANVRFPAGSHRLRAYAVCADGQGGVWVSEDALYRFDAEPPHELTTVSNAMLEVHAFFRSSNGEMWVGGENGFLGRYVGSRVDAFVPELGFTGSRSRCITEDSSGRIWIGTEGGRLFCRNNGKIAEFGQSDGLPDAPIRALYGDATGGVWVGTIGGGLVLVRDGKFTPMSVEDGLPDDNIAAIVEDDHGQLWFGSRSGIFHVAKADLEGFASGALPRFSGATFGRSEGLYGVSCLGSVQPMASKGRDGRLWFATRQGVLSLDVNRMKIIPRSPPVFIDEVLVNNRPLALADALEVPPLCKRIEFRFAVLSFAAPEKVRVRHLLEGVDSDWTEMVGRREVVYTGLQPGRYQLRVKACNSDGVWNEAGATLAFMVQPTWWQIWWVRGLALGLAAVAVGVGVRRWSHRRLTLRLERLEQQQALEHERERIARDIHDDLGAGLTQIMLQSSLAQQRPQDQSGGHLAQISATAHDLVGAMDEIVWAINPENDTLDELVTYTGKFVEEYAEQAGLRCRLDLPAQLPSVVLSAEARHNLFLAVKETLNNVVKHARATEVSFSLKLQPSRFAFVIIDDGCGFTPGTATASATNDGRIASGNGLRNLVHRLEKIGGTCEIHSEPEKGTKVELTVKIQNNCQPPQAGRERVSKGRG